MAAYKEIADPSPRSANYDPNYPILGKKIGPMLDVALSSWNRSVGDQFRINLGNRGWDSKRSSIAMDFIASKNRGLEDIFNKYTKDKGQLMTWVTGQLRRRMQETIERGVGKETNIREAKVGDFVEFERVFSDVDVAGGKIDKSFDNANPAIKPKGIQLKNHDFTFGERKRTIDPESINNIEKTSKETFNNTKVEDFTYQKIAEKILQVTTPEMTNLFGGKEGMKPKELYETQIKFIKENAPVLYDAMPLTSHPKFYENTMIGKTILNRFYKNTGKKYITDELSVEEAARTNARTFKYEKLPATKERIQELVDLMQSGRDAGTNNKKVNILKEHVGKVLGNQVFRDLLNNPEFKKGLDTEGLKKLESVKAELAMRKLRGAVPEKLFSEDLDVMNRFIKDVKSFNYAKELFPGFHVRNLIENTKEYRQLLEKTGGIDSFLKDMGYELKGINLKTFQQYARAQRDLGTLNTKVVEPKIFKNWSDLKFQAEIQNVFSNEVLRNQLKIGEQGWYKNWNNVKEFDSLVNWLKDNTFSEIFTSQMIKKSVGMGLGKVKFATEKEGVFKTRNNPYWENLIKDIKTSKEKAPKWVNQYKTTDNGKFKEAVNNELAKADLSTPEKKQKFAKYITKKYLTRKGVSYENTIKANQKMQEYIYGKLFDYYQNAPNKAIALNNIFRLLQMQTSIGNGFTRSLATHDAITIRHVENWGKGEGLEKTHSEHEFQTFGFNANFMLNMIKNSGNKTAFLNNFKPLSKIFRQSIIDRSVQKKYDSPEYGGTTSFDFKFTTESGKYPWLRERVIAETTLDLKTGKTYDQLLPDVIIGGKTVRLLEARKNQIIKQLGFDAKKMSPTEKVLAIKTIDNALALGVKRNKERRGGSFWDFDDTLATTKSGVRARIPNTDGLPKPSRKVIFLAGGAGSGKSNVVKKLGLEKDGFKIVNQDISLEWLKKNNGLPENMNDLTKEQRSVLGKLQHQARGIAKRKMMKFKGNADGVVVDGTGGSMKAMEKLVTEFKEKGYDVSMLFVETSLKTALERNRARKERSLLDKIVEKNHESVQGNKPGFKTMFGERFMEVKTDNLKMEDAMPKELVDKMNDFVRGYEKIRLDAEQFASEGQNILDKGGKFDFSEFNVVTGGQRGPFFEKAMARAKKFGTKDQFIITARPPESAKPIYEFLKSQGLEIPLENITGLGNSTAEAKALYMLRKFEQGYNDMYFADDALQNVKAVRDVLSQLDIKYKVQQALASENLDISINKIMEHSLNIDAGKKFSKAEAKVRGKDIKGRRFFLSNSASDLELLIEPLYGKGGKGIKNKEWFDRELIEPFERGIDSYNTARQTAKNDYMSLRKNNKDIVKILPKEVEGTSFTHDMAMRVYLWNKVGYKIPDLAKTTEAKLVEYVQNNPKLKAYAEAFARITKQDKGLKEPSTEWWAETMAGEVTNIDRGVSRKQYLQEFIDIKNEIFSEVNLNKMESKLGTDWRENITDMLDRMETGRTRSLKLDRGSSMMMNYLNGGVGTIMNFNTRSAALQTISTLNFLNMRENNPIAAAKAMGNVPQFSKDFLKIMNSDMLKQRRDGLSINVTEAEIASAAASSKNPIQSIISKVLKVGYTPTKLADSFAISFGGATYYRNRIKMYEKQGLSTKEAEGKAWTDFQKLSERTQQSSRPDLLSKQQTSLAGRIILPFANTPMQMNRRGMKDILDISKGRYKNNVELAEKMGRITYYMGAQVALFAGLQSALFAMMLNDEDVSDEKIMKTKEYTLNTISDSFLRGMGISGAVASGFKNATIAYMKQSEKGFRADYSEVGEALLNISPPIGSKFGRLDAAGERIKWAKIKKQKPEFKLGNPYLEAGLLTVESITNAPVYSPYQNAINIQHALSNDYENWQRAHMIGGYTPYNVGIETKTKVAKTKLGPKEKLLKLKKNEQVDMLLELGLPRYKVNRLKLEKDRVEKIMELQNKKKKKTRKSLFNYDLNIQ